ncbi:MAG: SOS response-associated peptidase [Methanomassiliicoccales archaeon]|nr:MAG: SOS response-associated peptidase [Methanomassiliicoccales archaeon]
MCFDISYAQKSDRIEDRFHAKFETPELFEPAYHVSAFSIPYVPVITNEKVHTLQMLRWGLVPFWVKNEESAMQIRTKTFNARAETLFEKPSFRTPIKNKRCLVIADGFFEWREVKGKNYPYYIRLADKSPFAMAGIWDTWHNREIDEKYHAFSVITTKANPLLEKIHNKKKRMPALLRKDDEKRWLSEGLSKNDINSMLSPIDDSGMEAHTVSKMISYRKGNTNVPEVLEKFEYDELKFQQTSLF